ncbi:MAG: hypothetical protein [Wendovervirus sonii]|uniref:Uncharacterized protein n=1 Tax=phage Lak_Megaphage_Sonny TaxID=3109229 RepID=A0ABZ0Z4G5_9CAUD|nr:MAG: hypothetical protein [phage Lak_Megaphage_Sonny]
MKREELLSKFKAYTAKKAELQKKEYSYIVDKPCMQLGRICGMSMPAIKTAYCVIDEMTGISDKVIKELCIDETLFNESEKIEYSTFDGFTRDEWMHDLKTRVSEIQNARRIEQLERALPLIEKWLSSDDLFMLDVEEIEKLLAGV